MRIVFMGSGAFGLPTLEALCEAHEPALVISQPDRPAGRKRQLTATPIAAFTSEHGIDTIKPPNVNAADTLQAIQRAAPDAIVVIAFGQKIGPDVIGAPARGASGTMNLHGSILPAYRGAAPINWAICNGETETGVTMIHLADRMDAGDMLGTRATPIDPAETAGELHDRLAALGPELTLDVLGQLEAGTLNPAPQDESRMSLAPKLSKSDAQVDFTRSADQVRQTIHGLTPWPGVTVQIKTSDAVTSLRLHRAESLTTYVHDSDPGTLIADGIIAVGDRQAVRLIEVQPPGKRTMSWHDFQQGHALPVGTQFIDRPM